MTDYISPDCKVFAEQLNTQVANNKIFLDYYMQSISVFKEAEAAREFLKVGATMSSYVFKNGMTYVIFIILLLCFILIIMSLFQYGNQANTSPTSKISMISKYASTFMADDRVQHNGNPAEGRFNSFRPLVLGGSIIGIIFFLGFEVFTVININYASRLLSCYPTGAIYLLYDKEYELDLLETVETTKGLIDNDYLTQLSTDVKKGILDTLMAEVYSQNSKEISHYIQHIKKNCEGTLFDDLDALKKQYQNDISFLATWYGVLAFMNIPPGYTLQNIKHNNNAINRFKLTFNTKVIQKYAVYIDAIKEIYHIIRMVLHNGDDNLEQFLRDNVKLKVDIEKLLETNKNDRNNMKEKRIEFAKKQEDTIQNLKNTHIIVNMALVSFMSLSIFYFTLAGLVFPSSKVSTNGNMYSAQLIISFYLVILSIIIFLTYTVVLQYLANLITTVTFLLYQLYREGTESFFYTNYLMSVIPDALNEKTIINTCLRDPVGGVLLFSEKLNINPYETIIKTVDQYNEQMKESLKNIIITPFNNYYIHEHPPSNANGEESSTEIDDDTLTPIVESYLTPIDKTILTGYLAAYHNSTIEIFFDIIKANLYLSNDKESSDTNPDVMNISLYEQIVMTQTQFGGVCIVVDNVTKSDGNVISEIHTEYSAFPDALNDVFTLVNSKRLVPILETLDYHSGIESPSPMADYYQIDPCYQGNPPKINVRGKLGIVLIPAKYSKGNDIFIETIRYKELEDTQKIEIRIDEETIEYMSYHEIYIHIITLVAVFKLHVHQLYNPDVSNMENLEMTVNASKLLQNFKSSHSISNDYMKSIMKDVHSENSSVPDSINALYTKQEEPLQISTLMSHLHIDKENIKKIGSQNNTAIINMNVPYIANLVRAPRKITCGILGEFFVMQALKFLIEIRQYIRTMLIIHVIVSIFFIILTVLILYFQRFKSVSIAPAEQEIETLSENDFLTLEDLIEQ